ncbi:hypothetical protein HUT18_15735 [Streptomyces sp. NA04227]|uniref:hypothetical protein n=1 Tax=Streptomyces sp. NA04227 TaxID=2742136 RepID=UPI00159176F0|nr:hypothetical protein [Streptomyces sp. NA04227]QKW07614.1 hypothetical protein HUT18_15735 [Streptomyces sp. NA04227]
MFRLTARCVLALLSTLFLLLVPGTASATGLSGSSVHVSAPAEQVAAEEADEEEGEAEEEAFEWSYHIGSSCEGLEADIREGADFWEGAQETEGSGTRVNCTEDMIQGCGDDDSEEGESEYIGCNWGDGTISVSTQADDFPLIVAHEFGHNWYEHSDVRCMGWASEDAVMAPTMC